VNAEKRHALIHRLAAWIVHCSAGIGRTGAFLAIDIGMRQLEHTRRADVIQIIIAMRKDRGGMVQHSEQAAFVHDVLAEFVVWAL
jgi:protein tyrosine phosphatase